MFVFLLALAGLFTGIWDATIDINGNLFPFRLEIAGEQGWFFDGDQRIVSTSGHVEGDKLILKFDRYATALEATIKDGKLEGSYGPYQKQMRPFVAVRHVSPQNTGGPNIAGEWEIAVEGKSNRGEHAWRLLVVQDREVSATILRVDGDSGTLTGGYREGRFVLSHFSGMRPALLVLQPAADGTLAVDLTGAKGTVSYVARRPPVARAQGLAEPDDPDKHTGVKDVSEPFRFSFPDLNGKIVSNTDARFQGKIVLVNILGSWCPNCHDEAPFLMELYRKYKDAGLEIVGIAFEYTAQLKDPTGLRFFVKTYNIEYPVLLAGDTDDAAAKLPQAAHFDSWPTTFFLGRNGRVRAVHAGFAGPATGELYQRAKREFQGEVERLLKEEKELTADERR